MKPMTWVPDEEHDRKVNEYLARENHAPYEVIVALGLLLICAFTAAVLIGNF